MSYVYIESESFVEDGKRHHLFTVGFYKPNGKFESESDWAKRKLAAARVHYLNGGDAGYDMPYTANPDI